MKTVSNSKSAVKAGAAPAAHPHSGLGRVRPDKPLSRVRQTRLVPGGR
jgi:hypothetical protein